MSPSPLPAAPVARSPGVAFGALSVFRGLTFIVRTPGTWALAAVPALVLLVLFGAGTFSGLRYAVPALLAGLTPESWYGRLGAGLLHALLALLVLVASALAAAWLAPALSGPALERLLRARERALGLPERNPVPVLLELWCGLRAQLLGLVVGGPVLLVLWLVTLAAPPAAVVTVPAKLVVVSLLVAWNLLDYPLSLQGLRLRERLRLLGSSPGTVLGFGAAITALFAVPLGAIVLLPAGVVGAAEIAAALEGRRHALPQ